MKHEYNDDIVNDRYTSNRQTQLLSLLVRLLLHLARKAEAIDLTLKRKEEIYFTIDASSSPSPPSPDCMDERTEGRTFNSGDVA